MNKHELGSPRRNIDRLYSQANEYADRTFAWFVSPRAFVHFEEHEAFASRFELVRLTDAIDTLEGVLNGMYVYADKELGDGIFEIKSVDDDETITFTSSVDSFE